MQKKTKIALLLCIIIILSAVGIYSFYQFTSNTPDTPRDFTATKISDTRIDLTWVKAKTADTTLIERNNITSWKRGEGTEIYNDTGEHTQDSVPPLSHFYYQAWSWNQTQHTYSGNPATTETAAAENQPPDLGTQSPANGSRNTLLSFTWSIYISDPEGNTFSWTIQCNNTQANSGASSSNGTKTLFLIGLTNATKYTIWVNATDTTGSGNYTRRWYTFTTISNQTTTNRPPVFGTPTPINGSKNNSLGFSWSIPISDPEGDSYAWSIHCSNKQITSGTSITNGTKTLILTGLKSATTYKIWVNASDSLEASHFVRRWYTFATKTTQTTNDPPVFGTAIPANESSGNPLNLTWKIPIKDLEGNTFNWTIQCHGQNTGATGASNGTKTITLTNLSNATAYKVWVNATDPTGSGSYTRKWYTFTTQTTHASNNPPKFGMPIPANGSTQNPLNLTWSIPITDPEGNPFNWSIQCHGQMNSATGASDGTKTLTINGLSNATTYKVWVNATDPTGSGVYTRKWYTFTTKTNLPPEYGTPSPTNRSTNIPLNITWSIPITDPDADPFSWTIQCSNGQKNNSLNATNGTKSLQLSGLKYTTTYKVWVNATDPTGSGLFTRRWFSFTTITNNPPIFGTPSPTN
jgi:hypothetical protein